MRLTKIHFQKVARVLDHYSKFYPSALSIKQFIDFGEGGANETKSFLFLRKELLVRLANIMKEISHLPEPLLAMPSVEIVRGWYRQSFQEILAYEREDPKDDSMLTSFADALVKIRDRHSTTVETMAQGVVELKEKHLHDQRTERQIQYFLDRFLISRISIRMLINQHSLLFGSSLNNNRRHIGCIDPYCDVLDVAQDAYEHARHLCDQYYMTAPNVVYHCQNPHEGTTKVTMTYVPSHLFHMLFELFKNALRAVVEHHGDLPSEELPKLHVLICKGKQDLTIKISDQGGGIPKDETPLLFEYMYSTAPRPPSPQAASIAPLAGYGYGLPLSRLYAKYFNGDLQLFSVEGYGTDAMIYLKALASEANELLPIYNKTTQDQYSMSEPVGDWSDPTQSRGLHASYQGSHHYRHFHTMAKRYRQSLKKQRECETLAEQRHCKNGTQRDLSHPKMAASVHS